MVKMNEEKAAEVIEKMILHEQTWLKDFGRKPTNERIEALKMASMLLRREDYERWVRIVWQRSHERKP